MTSATVASERSVTGEIRIIAAAQTSQLSGIRSSVASFVGAVGGSEGLCDDARIVVSELVTNVIQHAVSDTVTVCLSLASDGLMIDVSEGGSIEKVGGHTERSVDEATGRGLMVVNAIANSVELVDDGGSTKVRCSLAIA